MEQLQAARAPRLRGGEAEEDETSADTMLHDAATFGRVYVARAILERRQVDMAGAGLMALYLSATHGHLQVVRLLLNRGAAVDGWSEPCLTPLYMAAREGHLPIAALLMDRGASVHGRPDAGGRTPLHAACARGHPAVARALLDRGADVDAVDDRGMTPLYGTCAAGGRIEMAQLLLDRGAAVAGADGGSRAGGLTPLHVAAWHGRLGIVRALLRRGAAADAVDEDGCTPIHRAAVRGHVGVAAELLASGPLITMAINVVGSHERRAREERVERTLRMYKLA